MMWVGLVQSVEGLKRLRLRSFRKRGNLPLDLKHQLFPGSEAYGPTADLGLVNSYNHVSQFLRIIYICLSIISISIHPVGSISLENPQNNWLNGASQCIVKWCRWMLYVGLGRHLGTKFISII